MVGRAANGAEAVRLHRELRRELVTLEIVMPDMGGIDAVREIIEQDPEAPRVVR